MEIKNWCKKIGLMITIYVLIVYGLFVNVGVFKDLIVVT